MAYLDSHGLTTLWNKIKTYLSNYHDPTKQDKLVSGTNIKTVNNNSLLGSGNITIQGGGDPTAITDERIEEICDTDMSAVITFNAGGYATIYYTDGTNEARVFQNEVVKQVLAIKCDRDRYYYFADTYTYEVASSLNGTRTTETGKDWVDANRFLFPLSDMIIDRIFWDD